MKTIGILRLKSREVLENLYWEEADPSNIIMFSLETFQSFNKFIICPVVALSDTAKSIISFWKLLGEV